MSSDENSDVKNRNRKTEKTLESRSESIMPAFTIRVVVVLILMTFVITWINLGAQLFGAGYIRGDLYEGNEVPSLPALAIIAILALVAFRTKGVAKTLRLNFTKGELSSIYIGVALMVGLLSCITMWPLLGSIVGGPYGYMEDPDSFSHVAEWSDLMFVWNEEAIWGFIQGDAAVPWSVWIVPMLLWGLFYACMVFLLFAIGVLFYNRWNTAERLVFPLVKPVVATVQSLEGTSEEHHSKNKIFVAGILITVVIQLLRLLNMYAPAIPAISLYWDIGAMVPGQIGEILRQEPGTYFNIHPFVVGIGYFLSTQFGFSIWFFYYIVHRLIMNYALYTAGLPIAWNAYGEFQYRGAYIILAIVFAYLAKDSIKEYFKAAVGKSSQIDPEKMPMSPKLLFYGSLACILFLLIIAPALLNVSPFLMLIHLFLLLCLGLFHARCRVEAGMPFSMTGLFTRDTIAQWFGSNPFSKMGLEGLQLFSADSGWLYTSSGAWMMEGLKISESTGTSKRGTVKVLLFTLALVFIVGMPLFLRGAYYYGASRVPLALMYGQHLTSPIPPQGIDPTRYGIVFSLAGGALALGFSILYMNFLWWPFHPLGYALGMQTDFGFRFPGSFFVAWLIKAILLRYGGASLYNKFKPLFMGLILGDLGMRILITIIATAFPT